MEFKLKSEFVELDNVMKATGLAVDGAEAKRHIAAGSVKVNGEVETRIRRKLRSGDSVEFEEHRIEIAAQP
jgi:ribosome-associated protein